MCVFCSVGESNAENEADGFGSLTPNNFARIRVKKSRPEKKLHSSCFLSYGAGSNPLKCRWILTERYLFRFDFISENMISIIVSPSFPYNGWRTCLGNNEEVFPLQLPGLDVILYYLKETDLRKNISAKWIRIGWTPRCTLNLNTLGSAVQDRSLRPCRMQHFPTKTTTATKTNSKLISESKFFAYNTRQQHIITTYSKK